MAEGGDASKDPVPQKDEGKLEAKDESPQSTSEWLMNLMKRSLRIGDSEKPKNVLEELTLEGVVKYILDNKCKKIITMAGAGISTSAGIPDFRSPGTGLYDNLQKYDLPNPQAIFEIGFFKENPKPFYVLAKELFPAIFKPTPCHYFLRLLNEKGLLLRHFTQNIDTLEHVAGISSEKIVEAHGTFHTSHCLDCGKAFSQDWMKEKIFSDEIPTCDKENCGGLVKPDIVFFGEQLPSRFFQCVQSDLPQCDLLIIMGTSLVVQPFASLTNRVPDSTPRLYINLEKPPGTGDPVMAMLGMGHSFMFDSEDNYRDVFWEGTCDDGCSTLADKLGWGDELQKLVETEHKRIDKDIQETKTEAERLQAAKENSSPAKGVDPGSTSEESSSNKDGTCNL